MSTAQTHRPIPKNKVTALVLQGGGALGAYQGGAFEALAEAGTEPTLIAGISIGAINAAIIAGNAPERRVERLRAFWERISNGVPAPVGDSFEAGPLRGLANGGAAAELRATGANAIAIGVDVTDEAGIDAAVKRTVDELGGLDVLISNAGIRIVAPLQDFSFSDWKKLLAVHLDGAFLTSRAAMRQMIASGKGGSIIFMGSVHSKEASMLKAPYVTAKHGLEGLTKVIAKEGAAPGIRANIICPGFVRTPLVDKQIPEQAKALGISEDDVIKKLMLKETVDGEIPTVEDVAQVALMFEAFPSNALTGQSMVVSHGCVMQ